MVAGMTQVGSEYSNSSFEKMWGIFDDHVSSDAASIETIEAKFSNIKGYKLVFSGVETGKADKLFTRLKNLKDITAPVFRNVQSVQNDNSTQDVVAIISKEYQKELLNYLQEKGVEFAERKPEILTDIAWSKDLAKGVLTDLSNLWPLVEGQKAIKDKIKSLQKNYLVKIRDNGSDSPEISYEHGSLKGELYAVIQMIESNVDNARATAILETLQERLNTATQELPPVADKSLIRNDKLDKFINALRKAGEDDIANKLEVVKDNPAKLAGEIADIAESASLKPRMMGLLKGVHASLNGVEPVAARM